MTEYITLIINEQVLEGIMWSMLFFIGIFIMATFIQIIIEEIERNKRRRLEKIAEPYKKEYQKLQDEEEFEEAKEYRDKYSKYIYYGSYY